MHVAPAPAHHSAPAPSIERRSPPPPQGGGGGRRQTTHAARALPATPRIYPPTHITASQQHPRSHPTRLTSATDSTPLPPSPSPQPPEHGEIHPRARARTPSATANGALARMRNPLSHLSHPSPSRRPSCFRAHPRPTRLPDRGGEGALLLSGSVVGACGPGRDPGPTSSQRRSTPRSDTSVSSRPLDDTDHQCI